MKKQERRCVESGVHPTAAKAFHIFCRLDADTPDDADVDYKKLYCRAFNSMTEVLEDFEYPDVCTPVLLRVARLQQELEDQYMNG